MTGYTYDLIEKKLDFKAFAMLCAKAFGACIDMKDDSIDTPIPEQFVPDSHYADCLQEAKDKLKAFKALTKKEQKELIQKEWNQSIKEAYDAIKANEEENKILQNMIEQVKAYTPPSKLHVNYKTFMMEQLVDSMHSNNYSNELIEAYEGKKVGNEDVIERINILKNDVVYYEKKLEEEKRNYEKNNLWISQLRESLKGK